MPAPNPALGMRKPRRLNPVKTGLPSGEFTNRARLRKKGPQPEQPPRDEKR